MEVKIQIPDNCELIKNGNTYVVREKDSKPKSWEEFCEKYPINKEEYFIGTFAEISKVPEGDRNPFDDRDACTSEEEAEAFLALMQLRQLRKAWISDWNPTSETKLFAWIETSHNHYKTYVNYGTHECNRVLSFPTKGMAEDFLNCFRDLCEQARILL